MKKTQKKRKHTLHDYRERKKSKLTNEEAQEIRARVERGQADVYELAREFGCVPAQIAGVKARMKF